jgi:CO/xanthine dehydrogenase Mo-binding subunit
MADVEGKSVRTIESLARAEDALHPVQQAFIHEGASQCGYCTPGMIMAAVALLGANARPSEAEIVAGDESESLPMLQLLEHHRRRASGERGALMSEYQETVDEVEFRFQFDVTRRRFVQVLGAGLLIVVTQPIIARAQQTQPSTRRGDGRGRRGGFAGEGPVPVVARIHIGRDGAVTVLTGKVECGQGARAELTQAAAEELHVPVARVALIMGDTLLAPDDGMTAGSRTTPATVPAVRAGAAAARELLMKVAAERWSVDPSKLEAREGSVIDADGNRRISYADLAGRRIEEEIVWADGAVAGQRCRRSG